MTSQIKRPIEKGVNLRGRVMLKKILIGVGVLVALLVIFSFVFSKLAGNALELMTPEQNQTLLQLRSFTSKTTVKDISSLFGSPTNRKPGDITVGWEIDQDGDITYVKAYFLTGGLNKIQFMSLKPFWGYTLYYNDSGVTNEVGNE